MPKLHLHLATLPAAFALLAAATTGALAQKKYDTGASDTEIKIGNIMPYSGPASAYGVIGKTVPVKGTEDYATVFELRFYGKRRLSGAGVPYIKAQVYPERKAGDPEQAMDGCF